MRLSTSRGCLTDALPRQVRLQEDMSHKQRFTFCTQPGTARVIAALLTTYVKALVQQVM